MILGTCSLPHRSQLTVFYLKFKVTREWPQPTKQEIYIYNVLNSLLILISDNRRQDETNPDQIDCFIREAMGLLPDTQNCELRMRRECRERFPAIDLKGNR